MAYTNIIAITLLVLERAIIVICYIFIKILSFNNLPKVCRALVAYNAAFITQKERTAHPEPALAKKLSVLAASYAAFKPCHHSQE